MENKATFLTVVGAIVVGRIMADVMFDVSDSVVKKIKKTIKEKKEKA